MKNYITQEEINADINLTEVMNLCDFITESILASNIETHGIVVQAINPNFKDFETAYDRFIRNKRKKESDYCMC